MSGSGGSGPEGLSMSKVLPQIPDMDTQLALAAKMIDKKTSTPKGSHSYGAYFLEYSLLAEFQLLLKQKLPGIYVVPSQHSPTHWHGVLFIRQGLYQEGVFRFQVLIPNNFPDGDVPNIAFEHPVFHPSIDPVSHKLNVKQYFPKWKRNVNHIWQVLLFCRKVFYKLETAKAVNAEAAQLYQRDLAAFRERVRSCVTDWKERLYTPHADKAEDSHYFNFSPYQPHIHDSIREMMKQGRIEAEDQNAESQDTSDVKSYVAPGSLTIFSEKIVPGPSDGPKSHPQ